MHRSFKVSLALSLLCVLATTGCATKLPAPPPATVAPPTIPSRPAVCEQRVSPNYSTTLQQKQQEWQKRLIELQQM